MYLLDINTHGNMATGLFPVQIKNNSNLVKANQVFLVGKGVNPNQKTKTINGKTVDLESFIKFNSRGIASFVAANGSGDAVPSVALSDLPIVQDANGDDVFQIKMPATTAGRIFISLQQPLPLTVVEGKNKRKEVVALTIAEDDPYKRGNVSFGMIYDKVEFTYNDDGIWINTTAVDFFAMPLGLSIAGGGKKTGLDVSRAKVIDVFKKGIDHLKTNSGLDASGQNLVEQWKKCIVEQSGAQVRIIAPNKAFGRPNGAQDFDHTYLNPYIDAVWNFYAQPGNVLEIDCKELIWTAKNKFILKDINSNGGKLVNKADSFVFRGSVVGNNFVFKNSLPVPDVISIGKPASNSVFGGDGGSFTAKALHASSVLVRELASAMNVGLLPLDSSSSVPRLNKDFFMQPTISSKFYQANPLLPAALLKKGLWYNVYSKLLHNFKRPLYTYAFDDALGLDGTLSTGNVANPPVGSVVIGDMRGTVLPSTGKDTTKYDVTIIAGGGAVGKFVHANGTEEQIEVAAGTPPKVFTGVTSPLTIKYNFDGNGTPLKAYRITLRTEVVSPSLGVNFNKTGTNTYTLSLPGVPQNS